MKALRIFSSYGLYRRQVVNHDASKHLKVFQRIYSTSDRTHRNNNGGNENKRNKFGIEWFYIPAGVGFSLICFIQLRHILKREAAASHNNESFIQNYYQLSQWQVDVLKQLPTRSLSRLWGYFCDAHIPPWLRRPLISSYVNIFKCNMAEALIEDLTQYDTFNKFFTRKLKPGARQVHQTSTVVSPADCTVLAIGNASTSAVDLEQIKGIKYPIDIFTGPRHPFLKHLSSCFEDQVQLPCQPESIDKVFYCSLYLGPGDYHWFHSPTEWTVEHRRHIPGHLFSVSPRLLRRIDSIFNFNERVLLSGKWEKGVFLYAAIGAYNVGSVKLDFPHEKDLKTNNRTMNDVFKDRLYGSGISLKRGEVIGRFELGSSIVLVFTAPKDFEFSVVPGQKLKYGERLGEIKN